MNVKDLMAQHVQACHINNNLHQAAHLMWDGDFGSVPVVNDYNQVVGFLTDRDIAMTAYLRNTRLEDIPVQEVMSKTVFSCHPNDSLKQVKKVMETHQVRRIPIVDDQERLVGIISLNDLARTAVRSGKKNGVTRTDVANTLAACCQPHPQSEASTT